jgi:hypothetical protein
MQDKQSGLKMSWSLLLLDRRCQRRLDETETAYYDNAQRKCVSELLCDIEGTC